MASDEYITINKANWDERAPEVGEHRSKAVNIALRLTTIGILARSRPSVLL